MEEIFKILDHIHAGEPAAAEALLPLVYDELRNLAAGGVAKEAGGADPGNADAERWNAHRVRLRPRRTEPLLTVRFSLSGATDISVRAGQTGMSGPPDFTSPEAQQAAV